ncbi:MAG: glycosyltransferase family 39 protein [Myxococcales bacterium]|nr:glycosyltransferase family 39 protein [Myxococcales bacterium]
MDDTAAKRAFGWETALLLLGLAAGLGWLAWYGGQLPSGWDADATGRVEAAIRWARGDGQPPFTQGPVHFLLLRLALTAGVPGPQLRIVDLGCAALFLWLFFAVNRALFGPAIAGGATIALPLHPFFAKLAAATTGFMPFFALLWLGFWLLIPYWRNDGDDRKIGRAFAAGVALGAATLTRFEGLFVVACLGAAFLGSRRWKPALSVFAGFAALAGAVFASTYFSLADFLRGGFYYTVHPEPVPPPHWAVFPAYLAGALGIVPLLGGLAGTWSAVKEKSRRALAGLLWLYLAMVYGYYLAGRLDCHWSRYYSLLLPLLLPFFGAAVARALPAEKPLRRGAVIVAAFLICAGFYFVAAGQELYVLQTIGGK